VLPRAHGMSDIAKETGLNRENLYRLGSDANPELATIVKVLTALGIELTAHSKVA
jgi:probable addiction module antidote protein